jgi:hypothetical protein
VGLDTASLVAGQRAVALAEVLEILDREAAREAAANGDIHTKQKGSGA